MKKKLRNDNILVGNSKSANSQEEQIDEIALDDNTSGKQLTILFNKI